MFIVVVARSTRHEKTCWPPGVVVSECENRNRNTNREKDKIHFERQRENVSHAACARGGGARLSPPPLPRTTPLAASKHPSLRPPFWAQRECILNERAPLWFHNGNCVWITRISEVLFAARIEQLSEFLAIWLPSP